MRIYKAQDYFSSFLSYWLFLFKMFGLQWKVGLVVGLNFIILFLGRTSAMKLDLNKVLPLLLIVNVALVLLPVLIIFFKATQTWQKELQINKLKNEIFDVELGLKGSVESTNYRSVGVIVNYFKGDSRILSREYFPLQFWEGE